MPRCVSLNISPGIEDAGNRPRPRKTINVGFRSAKARPFAERKANSIGNLLFCSAQESLWPVPDRLVHVAVWVISLKSREPIRGNVRNVRGVRYE